MLESSMTEYIGLSGYARSGKDTVVNYLSDNYGFQRVAFADKMRNALLALDPKIEVMHGAHPELVSLSSALKLHGWETLKAISPDVRLYLQRMGTEVGRNLFGDNFWVFQAVGESEKYDFVAFSDVRYQNEAKIIQDLGGEIWRVSRIGTQAVNTHQSEKDLDDFEFDVVIGNDGTLEELYAKIDELMEARGYGKQ